PDEQVTGEAGDRLGSVGQLGIEPIEDDRPIEGAEGRLGDAELDEEPPEAFLVAGPIDEEILAMVNQEAQLTLQAVEPSGREVGLTEGRPGDREGVDRIALARFAVRAASAGHELGRNAQNSLAGRQ